MEKYTDLHIDLREEEAEFVIKDNLFIVKFEIHNYVCIYTSMRFEYWSDELEEIVVIESKDLEKHGIDLDVCEDLHDEINKEIENWYYENYEVDPDENIEEWLEQKIKYFNA
jgi:hypothetical protein